MVRGACPCVMHARVVAIAALLGCLLAHPPSLPGAACFRAVASVLFFVAPRAPVDDIMLPPCNDIILCCRLCRQGAAVPGGGARAAAQDLRVGRQAQGERPSCRAYPAACEASQASHARRRPTQSRHAHTACGGDHRFPHPLCLDCLDLPPKRRRWPFRPAPCLASTRRRCLTQPTPPQILDCLDLPPEYRSLLTTDDHETNLHAGGCQQPELASAGGQAAAAAAAACHGRVHWAHRISGAG